MGTSGAKPTKNRSLISTALRFSNGEILIFDAGEDLQRKFLAAKLKHNKPLTILISHLHGDHVIGLPGLLFTLHLNERTSPVTIIGPIGIIQFLIGLNRTIGLKTNTYKLTIVEIIPPDPKTIIPSKAEGYMHIIINALSDNMAKVRKKMNENIIIESDSYIIRGYWLNHSVHTLGFRLEEKPLLGRFYPEKAREFGVPEGYMWRKMQQRKPVTINEGTDQEEIIDPVKNGIVGPKRMGISLFYACDTAKFDSLPSFIGKSDYLIIEATYAEDMRESADEKKHLTGKLAAEIAAESGVETLFLTHFSSRYKEIDELLSEAKEVFENTIAAEDLMVYKIKRKKE